MATVSKQIQNADEATRHSMTALDLASAFSPVYTGFRLRSTESSSS